ncbi:MAG: single-stranded-DNA-specific exonuclease RecJ [Candidatus Cloacimonadales bacterium]
MQKKWQIVSELNPEQLAQKKIITTEIKCPDMIAEMLVRKGLTDISEIKQFFEPDLSEAHDPFLFSDMQIAVERIERAIKNKEFITIFGDYDVDGTTSTALLYLGLHKIGAMIDFYIPHRMIDGYGLSNASIDQIKDNDTSLIISVDCGISALQEVNYINELGMDIIITDHHNPKEELPEAIAIINPKVANCPYPYRDLAGVGVAYKLLMAVYKHFGIDSLELVNKYIDLVALGTIADIVPLTGENRNFASIGLSHLAKKHNIGLNSLIDISGLSQKELNSGDIVFSLAPRINAAGRMGSALRAVELLIANDSKRSEELAEIIERENSLRQQEDQKTFREACEIIEKKYKDLENTPCLIVSSDDWHPGVIGIVASKLVEKYYRPSIMISFHDGIGSGSGRSIHGFDLFSALSSVENYLETFGGHKYAAGLSIVPEYLDIFENKLSHYIKNNITKEQLVPPLKLDMELELFDINDNLLQWLNRFAPFGPGNMRPTFFSRNVTIEGFPYNVGQNHLKLKVIKDGCHLDLIGFNLGDYLPMLKKGSNINIAYSLDFNTWQGKTTIQGKLKDLRINRNL